MSPCFYSIFPFTCFSAGALDHRLGNHSALNSRPIFSLFPGETCWIYKSLLTQEPGKRPSYSLFSNPPKYTIFAPPPPPTFAKTIVFKCSWEYCIFPRAMEDNNLRKIWGANRMYYGGFENRSEGSWLNKMWQLIFSFNQTKLAVLNRYWWKFISTLLWWAVLTWKIYFCDYYFPLALPSLRIIHEVIFPKVAHLGPRTPMHS